MDGLKAAKRAAPCGGSSFLDTLCCRCAFFFPFGIVQGYVMMFCPLSDPDGCCLYSKFHRAHLEWMDHVNAELEPKRCYLKLLYRERVWEMVIALTKSESEILKREPAAENIVPFEEGRAC